MSTDTPGTGPRVADDLYCGHFEYIDEKTLQRLFSKVAAVRSADKALFDFTHRPIEVFAGQPGPEDSARVVSEEEIYQKFTTERLKNFVVVIEGEVGTGKSELCAYLAHQLREDGRPILHVDKDDDLMDLLTERIPRFYREQFGEELPGTSEFEQLRDHIENKPRTVANYATAGAILNLEDRGYDVQSTEEIEADFSAHIKEKLQQLVERGEYAKEVKFITKGDYQQYEFLHIFENEIPTENAIEALNEQLWRGIQDRYEMASLNETLKQVGQRFESTRPVMVFEDFSIAAMEARKLRNYMERDVEDDNWDFIVAGTRDSTEVLHERTAEDRFEFYQTNERDSNSVLFLDTETAVDFVRPYLGYIKSEHVSDGSVAYDRMDDGTLTLQPLGEDTICARCGLCPAESRDLFPFNERFLRNIYTGLDASEQSPREFIMKVFEVFEEYYRGYVDSPAEATALDPLTEPLFIQSPIDDAEQIAALLRWFGDERNGDYYVEKRFATAFGMLKGVEEGDYPFDIDIVDDQIVVPSDGKQVQKKKEKKKPEQPPERDPVQELFEEHTLKLGPWKSYPEDNIQTGVYLKAGLRASLKKVSDDFALYEGTRLQYRLSSQKGPFSLTNTPMPIEDFQIRIDPEEFTTNHLRELLKYGVYYEEDKRRADVDELLTGLGTQLTGYAVEWREHLQQIYLNNDDILYKGHVNYDFADFVLASYALITVFDNPWEDLNAERLSERFQDSTEFSIDSTLEDWCRDILDPDQYEALKNTVKHAKYFEEMVGEFLGVTESALDLPEIRRRLERSSPYDVLSMLGRGYISNIPKRVEFNNGPSVRDLGHNAYDFRKVIDEIISRGPDEETLSVVESDLHGIEMSNVNEIVRKLETYDEVPPEIRESLKRFSQVTQENLEEVISAASDARRLQETSEEGDLQATLNSVKLRNSTVFKRYEEVELESGGQTTGLGDKFVAIGETYVE